LSLRYRPELELTLKNISLSIQDGEKIGVVGRTGAGKSSLLQALFRAVEPEQHSTYKIDGYDVLKMGLHTLRMSMCIIPQTPFLFNASIRQNIDPFESKSDEEIWTALNLAGLSPHIQNVHKGIFSCLISWTQKFLTILLCFQLDRNSSSA
jgi:ABC-type multidrug transport system fused ATPase/permease subunit